MKKVFKIIKRTILGLLVIIVTLIPITIFLWNNLIDNSVYYAKNMPRGEGQHPEIIILIDNLDSVYTPKLDGIEYDIDGTNTIYNLKKKDRVTNLYFDGSMRYKYASPNEEITYIFNKRINFVYANDYKNNKLIDLKDIDKNKVIEDINEFLKPIIDAQPEPEINLQWLFNYFYEDDFK